MANVEEPYQKDDGSWWMNVDPDDHNHVVANITKDLADRNTTATGVVALLNGVIELEVAEIQVDAPTQRTFAIALLTIDPAHVGVPSVTYRTTCASGARFDRTTHFNLEDH